MGEKKTSTKGTPTDVNAVIVPIAPGHILVDVGVDSSHGYDDGRYVARAALWETCRRCWLAAVAVVMVVTVMIVMVQPAGCRGQDRPGWTEVVELSGAARR